MNGQDAVPPAIHRRLLAAFTSLFIVERRIPQDRSSHLTYLVLFLVFLGAPFLIQLQPANAKPLTLFGHALPGACFSREIFHVNCPGCGMTRSFVAFAHGEFAQSWGYHRLGILLYLFFALRLPVHAWLLYRPRTAENPGLEKAYNLSAWIMIGLLLVNWVAGVFAGSNGG